MRWMMPRRSGSDRRRNGQRPELPGAVEDAPRWPQIRARLLRSVPATPIARMSLHRSKLYEDGRLVVRRDQLARERGDPGTCRSRPPREKPVCEVRRLLVRQRRRSRRGPIAPGDEGIWSGLPSWDPLLRRDGWRLLTRLLLASCRPRRDLKAGKDIQRRQVEGRNDRRV